MSKQIREDGYYWVCNMGFWIVAQWIVNCWYLPGFNQSLTDNDMSKIGDRVRKPKTCK